MKLLFALQFYAGDQEAAMSLARLIADVIPEDKCADADMMFASSADADLDFDSIRYCARKFSQVRTFRCVHKISGWPAGPNNHVAELTRFFAQQVLADRWHYSGIFLGEPDCVPLRRDFLHLLREEWDSGAPTVLGPWVTNGPTPYNQHINGNAIFGPRFIYSNPQMFKAEGWIGWDAQNAGFLMAHGRASRWIYSDYQLGSERNPWTGCDQLWMRRELHKPHPLHQLGSQEVAYLHGVKCWREAQACVRERLLKEEVLA